MQQQYLNVCGLPTNVITYGKWVEESFNDNEPKDIVLIIPGNPGATRFYIAFMETLHKLLGYPVWIVGHAGMERPTNDMYGRFPELLGNEKLYGLHGQIIHKQSFIETYVPRDARLHFIGHSVGAYIILQLLKDSNISSRVVKNYLLFPTIENLVKTPNGKFLSQLVCYIVWLLVFLSWIFTLLPNFVQRLIVSIYIIFYSVSWLHLEAICDLIHPTILKTVFHMAFDELELIKERDNIMIIKNKHKIKLYYGASDRWVPQSFYKKLVHDIPDIDAELCKQHFEHAFVLRNSNEVAMMVANWIKND